MHWQQLEHDPKSKVAVVGAHIARFFEIISSFPAGRLQFKKITNMIHNEF